MKVFKTGVDPKLAAFSSSTLNTSFRMSWFLKLLIWNMKSRVSSFSSLNPSMSFCNPKTDFSVIR